jgi:uncharacterized protein (DUF362 family)/Pyruvate/2-oxoacid:ferredoxin oxidoreductase delta subunit
MEKTRISIQRALHYESEHLRDALNKSLLLLGSLEKIIRPHSRILVKINHLSPPSLPEDAIITHPALTRELIHTLLDIGCDITVGDDIQSKNRDGFLISGYKKMCSDMGVKLVNLKEFGFREIPCKGRILTKTYISSLVLDCDFLINLPKLKTHSFTGFTGAVKNMYGVIPHGLRCNYHRKYPKSSIFGQMLVDIYSCVVPHLNIMDAIVAMEGEGPSAGVAKKVGLILASQDGVALDAIASKIIGLDPMQIMTIKEAAERGLGKAQMADIEIAGENIPDIQVKDFKTSTIAVSLVHRKVPAFLHGFIQAQLTLIPRVLTKKCTACKECVDICPTGSAQIHGGKARIDKSRCIHCMCCHEACRFRAIKLGQRPLGRMLRLLAAAYKKMLAHFS